MFDTATLARMVRDMDADELREGVRVNREAILSEVFGRFCERLTKRGRGQRAVVKWKVGEADTPDGYERWFVVLDKGRCDSGRDLDLEPRVTFTIGPVDLLRLVTGNEDPRRLVLTRRLRVSGDLLWAARMPGFFAPP